MVSDITEEVLLESRLRKSISEGEKARSTARVVVRGLLAVSVPGVMCSSTHCRAVLCGKWWRASSERLRLEPTSSSKAAVLVSDERCVERGKSIMNIFQKGSRIVRESAFHFGSVDLEVSLAWLIGNLDGEFRKSLVLVTHA